MDEKSHYLVSETKQNGQKNSNFVIINLKEIILDRSMFLFIKHNFDDKVKNIEDNQIVMGYPAVSLKDFMKNNISKNAWEKTQQISRKCYLASLAPGTKLEKAGSSIDKKFEAYEYSFEESEMGEDNFCVVTCKISTIEWLYLSVKGHRRAKIDLNSKENQFQWLVP
mgnify:CR=1 FL=1